MSIKGVLRESAAVIVWSVFWVVIIIGVVAIIWEWHWLSRIFGL